MDFLGNLVLHRAEPVKAPVLFLFRRGVFHFCRGRTLPGGENEGKQAVVAHLADKGKGFLEFFLGFSGEAYDHVAGEDQVRHDSLGGKGLIQVLLPVIVPVHGFEHPAGAGLEGKVELLCDFGTGSHSFKQLPGCVPGMAGHKPDKKVSVDCGNGSQQIGKVHAAV